MDRQADQHRHAADHHGGDRSQPGCQWLHGGLERQHGVAKLAFAKGGLDNSGTISATDGYVDIGMTGGAITNSGTITAGNGYLISSRTAKARSPTAGTVTATGGTIT